MLTGDKVATKTFGGKPVSRRDIMSLADWLLVIGDQKIQTDYLPVAPGATISDITPLVEEVVVIPEEPVSYPPGTKLTWILPENDGSVEPSWASNSRTAIVLKDGILQVREVINGVTVMVPRPESDYYQMVARKFFSSLADWQQQLPAGGTIISTAGEDCSVPSIKRKVSKAQAYKTTSDAEYIREIMNTFAVRSEIENGKTPAQLFSENMGNIKAQMELLGSMTSKVNMLSVDKDALLVSEEMMKIDSAARKLRRASRKASSIMRNISTNTSKAHVVPQWFVNNYKQRLMAFVKGSEIEICCSRKNGIIGLSGDPSLGAPFGHYYGYAKTGTSFAELGLDMKADGKPRLKIYYRRESMEV